MLQYFIVIYMMTHFVSSSHLNLFVLVNLTGSEMNLNPKSLKLPSQRISIVFFFRQLVSCLSETHLQHRCSHGLVYTHQHVIMSIAKAWTLYRPLGAIFNDLYSFTQKTQMDFIWTTLQLPVWVPAVPLDYSPLTIWELRMFK